MVKPIVTPEEMRSIDAGATESTEVLVERAGWALAREALNMLGGAYGKRVAVFAGSGNNGADGIAAAHFLSRAGVRCGVVRNDEDPSRLDRADLVIDASVGTRLTRDFEPRSTQDVPVLAADIPSGVDGLTGEVRGSAVQADRTVTFAALKPGLLLGEGPDHAGSVLLAGIGLDCSTASSHMVEDDDLVGQWPDRARRANKWQTAVLLVGGSPGMSGALNLSSEAAARSGAGLVTVATPGRLAVGHREAISVELPNEDWARSVLELGQRFSSVVVGPGLSRSSEAIVELRRIVRIERPLLLDAGALVEDSELKASLLARSIPAVLTPHDGEFRRMTGRLPGPDRIADTRSLARQMGSVILLKGSPTIVAEPSGAVLVVTSGDQRLATAGSGDVLSGLIGAGLALGLEPFLAASLAAHAHGKAARSAAPNTGLIASDLLPNLAPVLAGATLA